VKLAEMPLMPNGKVDRRALPAPKDSSQEAAEHFVEPRDLTELRLSQIWEEVLSVRPVGVEDNFFRLGGHSLLAVRLVARIRKTFGCRLPVATLFQAGTIARLARILRRQAKPAAPSSLVEIQPGDSSQTPVFFVHPIGGHVLCYAKLAGHLGERQPFYAFQARGVEDGQEPLSTVEGMAAHYKELLLQAQPEGPYLLGGWSMGGVVAFEMARQLEAEGREVAMLALVDSALPPRRGGGDDSDDALLLSRFFADLLGQFAQGGLVPEHELRGLDPAERLDHLWEKALSANVLPPGLEREQVARLFEVFKVNAGALAGYVARPYRGPMTLFLAGEREGEVTVDMTRNWQRLAQGDLQVHQLPGDHYTLLRSPHVKALGEHLRACVAGAELRPTAPVQ
jgi:thioesterase domain-containing protein/acyl carrier protein